MSKKITTFKSFISQLTDRMTGVYDFMMDTTKYLAKINDAHRLCQFKVI